MKIVDTNILIRLATDSSFHNILEDNLSIKDKGFIHSTVILEAIYVLDKVYGLNKVRICEFIFEVLNIPEIIYEQTILLSLQIYLDNNLDFVDAIVVSESLDRKCTPLSKDKKLIRTFEKYRTN